MPSQLKRTNEHSKIVKTKPQVTVTKNSPPKDILHSSWEFLNAYQFFHTFRSFFELATSFSIENLEEMLLQTDHNSSQDNEDNQTKRASSVTSQKSTASTSNHGLTKFMIHIITPLLTNRKRRAINERNYQDFLQKLFPDTAKWNELNLLEKIKLLKRIELAYMDSTDEDFLASKYEKSPKELRLDPLGTDNEGWSYWYFGGTRLYREVPLPQGSNNKRGTLKDFTFEIACSTAEEWHEMINKLQSPSNQSSSTKELASKVLPISSEVISIFEAKEAARLKREAKIQRVKNAELLPKKRSRRLEVKNVEEVKKQKTMEMERQQAELEEYEQKQKIKEAKEAMEKQKQDVRIEEARLKNDIHAYVSSLISKGEGDGIKLKELRTVISSRASKEEMIAKIQGWVGLLGNDISCQVTDQNTVHFTSENPAALQSVLFRCVIRYYITILKRHQLESTSEAYDQISNVYAKFILNRYNNLDAFSSDLNYVLTTFLNTGLGQAIDLLKLIFASRSVDHQPAAEESAIKEHDAAESALAEQAAEVLTAKEPTAEEPAVEASVRKEPIMDETLTLETANENKLS